MQKSMLNRKDLWIPLAAWAVLLLSTILLIDLLGAKYLVLTRNLIQWDGQHYLTIAQRGYEVYPCEPAPQFLCGNVGWFPFYPMVSHAFTWLGIPTVWSLLVVSWGCLLASLILLYRLVDRRFGEYAAIGSVAALVLFPGSFYYVAGFPYSLMLLLSLWIFEMLERNSYRWLWLPVMLITLTYPSAVVIGLPIAWVLLRHWKEHAIGQRLSLVGALAAIPAGLLAFAVHFQVKFDDFFLYTRFQSQPFYAHEPAFPLVTIWQSLVQRPLGDPVVLIIIFVAATLPLFYRRRVPMTWQLYILGILLFTPAAGTTDCYYRHVIVAFPVFVFVGMSIGNGWRRRAALPWAIAAVVLDVWVLIDRYAAGRLM